ncbi:MAG: hypothetical protein WCR45_11485, partial [Bacteroidaceae bacterium]
MMATLFTGCGSSAETGDKLNDTTINGEEAQDLTFIRPGQSASDETDPVVKAISKYESMYGVSVQIVSADYDTWTTKVLSA